MTGDCLYYRIKNALNIIPLNFIVPALIDNEFI